MTAEPEVSNLDQLTPALYSALSPRRRRTVDNIYRRVLASRPAGGEHAAAKRAYTNAALLHIFTGNLLGIIAAVLLAGHFENVAIFHPWPVLVLGLALAAVCLAEEAVGVRQALQVNAYFPKQKSGALALPESSDNPPEV
ncbi:MAG: hypothetical protein ACTHMS_16695 [Jatrophihabitans sp.]|uniref:hypothetical protein n=1 Tax=Jatrophihabitans sp. TaxID=1932789 RepID=UPI003F7EF59A